MILKYMSVYVSKCVNIHYTCMHAYMLKNKQTNKKELHRTRVSKLWSIDQISPAACFSQYSVVGTWPHSFISLLSLLASVFQCHSRGAATDTVWPFMYLYMTQMFIIWPFTKKNLFTPLIKEHVHLSSTKSNIKKTNILSFIVFPNINSIVKCQWKWNSSPEHLKANFILTELGNYWPKNEMIMRKWHKKLNRKNFSHKNNAPLTHHHDFFVCLFVCYKIKMVMLFSRLYFMRKR